MPRIVSYPTASFKNALDLAESVYSLGGKCKIETCADKMGRKMSGGFAHIVHSAIKFGLVIRDKGQLTPSELFKKIQTAYTEEEKIKHKREAFLEAPLFKELYDKYHIGKLQIDIFDKILIREFDIDAKNAGRLAGYFLSGAKAVNLLNEDNTFIDIYESEEVKTEDNEEENNPPLLLENKITMGGFQPVKSHNKPPIPQNGYSISIAGPNGFNFSIIVSEDKHLTTLESIISLIKSEISSNKINENTESNA